MTFVATSIGNTLRAEDIALVKRLIKSGDKVELYGYLQKIPAEYFAIPTMGEDVKDLHAKMKQMMREVGEELGIPEHDRHFIDEILGPDGVFDEAIAQGVNTIITHDPQQLKQRFLSKMWDVILGAKDKIPSVVTIDDFVGKMEAQRVVQHREPAEEGIKEEPVYGPIFERGIKKGREETKKKEAEETPEPPIPTKKPRF